MEKSEKKTKLTLCDWCVLIAIIGLVASVSHPALSGAMEEKQLSDMVDRLQMVRSQIRLYRADYDGLYPGQKSGDDLSVTGDEFVAALLKQRADHAEPYMRQFPVNPYLSDPATGDAVTCVNDPAAFPMGTEGTGWWFNAATGEFYACDSEFHTNY